MRFELDEDELKKLNRWKEGIKIVYGEYGDFEFRFRPNEIGVHIIVWSDLAKTSLDLTDVSKW